MTTTTNRTLSHILRPLGAGLCFAALTSLAAPPFSLWGFSLIAILPLAWCATRPDARAWRGMLLAAMGSLPMWQAQQWWVQAVSGSGFVPFIIVLSLLHALFVAVLTIVSRRLPGLPACVSVPVTWVGVEFMRGELFANGYAWSFPAHPLIDAPLAPAIASVGGVYFVSFLLAFISGVILDAFASGARRRRVLAAAGIGACMIGAVVAGLFGGKNEGSRTVRIAAVQTNVLQSNKIMWTLEQELADYARFESLTRTAAAGKPAFIVWPETMMPGLTLEPMAVQRLRDAGVYFRVKGAQGERDVDATNFADAIAELSRELGVPLIIGEEAYDNLRVARNADGGLRFDRDARFNSVYMIQSGRTSTARYDKVRLTPFGEFMPYIHHFPALQQRMLDFAARGMTFDLDAGSRFTVFEVPAAEGPIRVVTPICFEVTVASHVRQLVFGQGKRRADIIVNLTNDGWFGSSRLARVQHLQIARWRCAELGTPMVRAANTGISAFVDARGRVLRRGVDADTRDMDVDGVLSGELTIPVRGTLYARLGDVVGWASLGGSLALLGMAFRQWIQARAARRAVRTP